VKIVQALRAAPLAAGDIAHLIGRTRPATSQHLKVLRQTGIVVGERQGNTVRYALGDSVNAQVIETCVQALDDVPA
jgi:DNA-binding transcriptional ArsR family regulator